jgi:hypothetical protein
MSVMLPLVAIWLAFRQPAESRTLLRIPRSTSHLATLWVGLMLPLAAICLAFTFGWNATGSWILGAYGLLFMLQILGMRIMLNLMRTMDEKP